MMDYSKFIKAANKRIKKEEEIREVDIEDEFCNFAKTLGCIALKLIILGLRGFPDRTVICPGGRIMFIEFKKPGDKPTHAQSKWLRILRGLGFYATYFDNLNAAKSALEDFLNGL